jgi:hypothetical protein
MELLKVYREEKGHLGAEAGPVLAHCSGGVGRSAVQKCLLSAVCCLLCAACCLLSAVYCLLSTFCLLSVFYSLL